MHFHVRDVTHRRHPRDGQVPRAARRHPPHPDLHRRPRATRGRPGGRECERGADDRPGDRARDAGGRAGCGRPRDPGRARGTASGRRRAARQCLCETFARVTERSALAGARWLGRADKEAAEEAAFSGARIALERMPIDGQRRDRRARGGRAARRRLDDRRGRRGVRPGARPARGPRRRRARRHERDLDDRRVAARLDAVAAGHVHAEDGGRAASRAARSRSREPVGDNVRSIAEAFGRMVNDITAIVLDRPRHHDLIEEIRASGARIKLIQDGDVTASISAAVRGTNDHLAIGIGGTRQAVLAAAALRCLGGELQAQLWPTRRAEIEEARAARDRRRRADLHDRRPRAAGGDRRRDRRLERRPAARRAFLADSARTHSLVMCTRCNWVRFVDGIHFFARDRREEVRLS